MKESSILKDLSKVDDAFFEKLVNLYEKRIYGYAYNMIHNSITAEDITQEIFIKIYKNLYKYDFKYPIEPWIFKISYNVILNYIKKNRNIIKEVSLEDSMQEQCVENSQENFEIRDIITSKIEEFKPDVRMILFLKIMDDLSFEQIGLIVGKTPSAVKLKFYRNRKILIKKLDHILNEV